MDSHFRAGSNVLLAALGSVPPAIHEPTVLTRSKRNGSGNQTGSGLNGPRREPSRFEQTPVRSVYLSRLRNSGGRRYMSRIDASLEAMQSTVTIGFAHNRRSGLRQGNESWSLHTAIAESKRRTVHDTQYSTKLTSPFLIILSVLSGAVG